MRRKALSNASSRLGAATNTSIRAHLYIALETGARRGELLALRWADIDLPFPELRIRSSSPPWRWWASGIPRWDLAWGARGSAHSDYSTTTNSNALLPAVSPGPAHRWATTTP